MYSIWLPAYFFETLLNQILHWELKITFEDLQDVNEEFNNSLSIIKQKSDLDHNKWMEMYMYILENES